MNLHKQLDNSIEIITAENIAFRYHVAGPFRRMLAYLLDLMIRVCIWVGLMILGMILFFFLGIPGTWVGLMMVLWFVMSWFYGGLFEALWNGQTPGKRLLQIRVLSAEGQPINALQAVLRNVLRAVDAFPFPFFLLGLLASTINDRFQRLGDLACGTMVVVEEGRWFGGVMRVNEPEALRLAAQIPASFEATRTQAQALAAYVQRRQYFSWMRRIEIAQHLGIPLRNRFDLPEDTNLDHLLCGLYHRTFITDQTEEIETIRVGSPFQSQSPFAREKDTTNTTETAEPLIAVAIEEEP